MKAQITEKEGKHYIKGKVVMLKAESSNIILRNRDGIMHHRDYYGSAWKDMGDVYQHLYITSDDEIKEGDWCYDEKFKGIFQYNEEIYSHVLHLLKKVIATTDTSLTIPHKHKELPDWNLPSPSESFIKAYIEAYNNGNVIEDVLVEVNIDLINEFSSGDTPTIFDIKLKNNNIIIKKMKDSWTREEMCSNMQQYMEYCKFLGYITPQQWIEENL